MDKKMQNIIEINKLSKKFKVKKDAGFIRNLFKPEFKTINAVDNISFSIKKGERVAFIGPNGAGKSTTIKMLSSIL
ncbi:MAG: ATP-binding cassette domain-containing protein, partial [Lactobacillus sp.]|nr:ATP-binding cassette domain-containing protein [Lactobacillus sp.]